MAAQPAGTISVEAACARADIEVADPYDIEVKAELQVNPEWWYGYGFWSQPLVADFDGDGIPEVAVGECSSDGSDCEFVLFAADGSVVLSSHSAWGVNSPFAAVELDGVPGAEVLRGYCGGTTCSDPDLIAQRVDGGILWRFEGGWDPDAGLTVADLRGDGAPEILNGGMVIDAQTGVQVGEYELNRHRGENVEVVDVDHDGDLEFAEGGRLFDSDGSTLWTLTGSGGGGVSLAVQADADPEPEFVFISEGFVVADTDGAILTQVELSLKDPGYSLLADLDGDGSPEVVVVTQTFALAAYRLDGSLVWQREDLGYVENVAAWDFDGDGASEVLAWVGAAIDAESLVILTGSKGDVVFSTQHSAFGGAQPVVADIDNDGHAEIILAGGAYREGPSPSVTIYHQVNDTWPAAGPAWPVPDYHLTNIGPAGEVPIGEPDPAPWTYNLFHARPAVDGQPANLTPTLVQTCSDTCEAGGSVQIEVRVTNSGPEDANEVLLRVTAGGTTVTETTLPQVGSGVMSAGVLLTIPGTSFDLGEVRVVVDPNGSNAECEEGDNEVVVADPR